MPFPPVAGSDQPYGPLVTFRTQAIFPPSAVYVGADDQLNIAVFHPGVAATITCLIRFLSPQGEIVPEKYTFTVVRDNLSVPGIAPKHAEGFILSAVISTDAPIRGQIFVRLALLRSFPTADFSFSHVLLQGYVTLSDRLAYPLSPPNSSIEGRGFPRILLPADPAAGTELDVTVDQGRRWALRCLLFSLNTAANVGNRTAFLIVDDGTVGNNPIFLQFPVTVTASSNGSFSAGTGYTQSVIGTTAIIGLPAELALLPGWRVRFSIGGMFAGDQITGCKILVEEWVTP